VTTGAATTGACGTTSYSGAAGKAGSLTTVCRVVTVRRTVALLAGRTVRIVSVVCTVCTGCWVITVSTACSEIWRVIAVSALAATDPASARPSVASAADEMLFVIGLLPHEQCARDIDPGPKSQRRVEGCVPAGGSAALCGAGGAEPGRALFRRR